MTDIALEVSRTGWFNYGERSVETHVLTGDPSLDEQETVRSVDTTIRARLAAAGALGVDVFVVEAGSSETSFRR